MHHLLLVLGQGALVIAVPGTAVGMAMLLDQVATRESRRRSAAVPPKQQVADVRAQCALDLSLLDELASRATVVLDEQYEDALTAERRRAIARHPRFARIVALAALPDGNPTMKEDNQ